MEIQSIINDGTTNAFRSSLEDPMLMLLEPIKDDDIDEIFDNCFDDTKRQQHIQHKQEDSSSSSKSCYHGCASLSGIQPTPLQDMIIGGGSTRLFGNSSVLVDSLFNQSSSFSSSSTPPTSLFSSSSSISPLSSSSSAFFATFDEECKTSLPSTTTPYEVLEGILSEASIVTPSSAVNDVSVVTPVASSSSSPPSSLFAGPSSFRNTTTETIMNHDDMPVTAMSLISTAEALLADDILADIPRNEFDLISSATSPSPLSSSPPSAVSVDSSSVSNSKGTSKRPHTEVNIDVVVPESTTSSSSNNNRPLKRTKIDEHMDQFDKLELSLSSSSSSSSNNGNTKKELKKRSSSSSDDDDEGLNDLQRFRSYQTEKWNMKFEELLEYKKQNGHCQVPHTYKDNIELGRWTKRQRYQRKLYLDGNKSSTMTEERIAALEAIGFVWDSHTALWETRYKELVEYYMAFGNSNVPSNFPPNPKLAVWTKCQRRQRKLLMAGKPSNISQTRIERLNKVEFVWEVRQCS